MRGKKHVENLQVCMTTIVKYFQTKRCEIMDLPYLAQVRDQWQVPANMLTKFHVI